MLQRMASPRMVLDQVPAPIGFVDRNLRVRAVNRAACRLYGYTGPRAILGRTVVEIVGPAIYARFRENIEAALSGETVMYEASWQGSEGELASEVHLTPRFGPTGEVVGCNYLSIDITARRQADAAQQALCQQLLLAHEQERRELALALHEGISQALTGLHLQIAAAEATGPDGGEMQQLVIGLTERTRRLAVNLRPPELEDFNLLLVLRSAVRRFEQRTGIRIEVRADGGGFYLPDPMQTAVFRIVEAALSNIEHHAGVREAAIDLTVDAGVLTVTVRDDGRGFDPARIDPGHGLWVMQVWARVAGGTVSVDTVAGAGVAVTARMPVT
jgi:PAS domain S-box-containing protein